jgi:hypothetical protein
LFHRINSLHGDAMALSNLGNLEAANGNGEAARKLYTQAIRILRPMSVRDACLEDVRSGGALHQAQSLARHTLACHSCSRRIVVLADSTAVPVGAAAVAAKNSLS